MYLHLFVIFFAVTLAYQAQVSTANDYYIGAVVEFNPSLISLNNLKRYENLIKEASKQKADIVVFPEGGLMGFTNVIVPDPKDKISPCDNSTFSGTIKNLSCAAKNNQIYVVVNLKEGRKIIDSNGNEKNVVYNTNVVFDRYGIVVARYAKYNLFDENADKPENPEPVFFTTDFGVTFGTFICFDMMFQEPTLRLAQQYEVTDFLFSTFWFSEMPFLTAYQVQQGWAEANNVNLLASGVNWPELGSTGSGIYNGKWGPLVVSFEDRRATKLLVARIKKIKKTQQFNTILPSLPSFSNVILDFTKMNSDEIDQSGTGSIELKLLHDQIFRFNSKEVTMGTFESDVCSENGFCCSFKVKVGRIREDDLGYNYRAVAFDGVRMFGKIFAGGVQSCGLILCNGPTLMNCTSRGVNNSNLFRFTEIQITGDFLSKNSIQIPTTLIGEPELKALPPKKYLFNIEKGLRNQKVTMELLWPITNLQTFAIWGRNFVRDDESAISAGVSSLLSNSLFLLYLCFLSGLSYL